MPGRFARRGAFTNRWREWTAVGQRLGISTGIPVGGNLVQYAPDPVATVRTVFTAIRTSLVIDQFST